MLRQLVRGAAGGARRGRRVCSRPWKSTVTVENGSRAVAAARRLETGREHSAVASSSSSGSSARPGRRRRPPCSPPTAAGRRRLAPRMPEPTGAAGSFRSVAARRRGSGRAGLRSMVSALAPRRDHLGRRVDVHRGRSAPRRRRRVRRLQRGRAPLRAERSVREQLDARRLRGRSRSNRESWASPCDRREQADRPAGAGRRRRVGGRCASVVAAVTLAGEAADGAARHVVDRAPFLSLDRPPRARDRTRSSPSIGPQGVVDSTSSTPASARAPPAPRLDLGAARPRLHHLRVRASQRRTARRSAPRRGLPGREVAPLPRHLHDRAGGLGTPASGHSRAARPERGAMRRPACRRRRPRDGRAPSKRAAPRILRARSLRTPRLLQRGRQRPRACSRRRVRRALPRAEGARVRASRAGCGRRSMRAWEHRSPRGGKIRHRSGTRSPMLSRAPGSAPPTRPGTTRPRSTFPRARGGRQRCRRESPKFDGVSATLVRGRGAVRGRHPWRPRGSVRSSKSASVSRSRAAAARVDPAHPLVVAAAAICSSRPASSRFERFNAWREANGYSILANAAQARRRARRTSPAEVQRYPLEFHAYAARAAEGVDLSDSHAERRRCSRSPGASRSTVEDRTVTGIEGCAPGRPRYVADDAEDLRDGRGRGQARRRPPQGPARGERAAPPSGSTLTFAASRRRPVKRAIEIRWA